MVIPGVWLRSSLLTLTRKSVESARFSEAALKLSQVHWRVHLDAPRRKTSETQDVHTEPGPILAWTPDWTLEVVGACQVLPEALALQSLETELGGLAVLDGALMDVREIAEGVAADAIVQRAVALLQTGAHSL